MPSNVAGKPLPVLDLQTGLHWLARYGLTLSLTADGQSIRIAPKEKINEKILRFVRENKPDLLDYLRGAASPGEIPHLTEPEEPADLSDLPPDLVAAGAACERSLIDEAIRRAEEFDAEGDTEAASNWRRFADLPGVEPAAVEAAISSPMGESPAAPPVDLSGAKIAEFLHCAAAFRRVRDGRLYEQSGFASFADYCRARWNADPDQINAYLEIAATFEPDQAEGPAAPVVLVEPGKLPSCPPSVPGFPPVLFVDDVAAFWESYDRGPNYIKLRAMGGEVVHTPVNGAGL